MISDSLQDHIRPITELQPDPANARKHSERNVEAIMASLARFGQVKPVVLGSNGQTVIAGNGTLEAAKRLGWTELAAVTTELAGSEATAFGIADNQTALLAEWDDEVLHKLIHELPEELQMATGFDSDEISSLIPEVLEPIEEDEPPAPPEEAVTKPGDLWIMGKHRLLCGDSTNPQHLEHLMDGAKAEMLFTDPPYGVDYDGGLHNKTKRDKLANDHSTQIYSDFLPITLSHVDGPCYMWYAGAKGRDVYNALHDCQCETHSVIIWHKTNATYAAMSAQYKLRHEQCIYFKPKGSTLRWCGASTEASVWNQDRDAINDYHPTQKPIALAAKAIGNHKAASVLDAFTGSGSTLMAAHNLGRTFYGMELEPRYCDVAVKRWEQHTGKKAKLVEGADGQTTTGDR